MYWVPDKRTNIYVNVTSSFDFTFVHVVVFSFNSETYKFKTTICDCRPDRSPNWKQLFPSGASNSSFWVLYGYGKTYFLTNCTRSVYQPMPINPMNSPYFYISLYFGNTITGRDIEIAISKAVSGHPHESKKQNYADRMYSIDGISTW